MVRHDPLPGASGADDPATLEELILGYLREPGASTLPGPEPVVIS